LTSCKGCPIFESVIDSIRKSVAESLKLKREFFGANERLIEKVALTISSALINGSKIMLYGNGGSAADAQHIAAEWVGRFRKERQPLPALALTTDTSILTAVGNDYGFDRIFSRQLQALGRKGDISIAISTSGNSLNVLTANDAARDLGLVTVGLTGGDGGKLAENVDYHINVPHKSSARVQEVHIMLGHILCELVDENMKGM
jgi:D-sedoheptulose 7-phosphate isomerase